jgi:very-short-patch-repair endonuclease
VEVDGASIRDVRERTDYFESYGWRVLRVQSRDIRERPEEVIRVIAAALSKCAAIAPFRREKAGNLPAED